MGINSSPLDGKAKHARVFPNSIKRLGEKSSVPVEGGGSMGNFGESRDFFIGW